MMFIREKHIKHDGDLIFQIVSWYTCDHYFEDDTDSTDESSYNNKYQNHFTLIILLKTSCIFCLSSLFNFFFFAYISADSSVPFSLPTPSKLGLVFLGSNKVKLIY